VPEPLRRPKANGNEIAGVKVAARHRFLLGVFVGFRRKPPGNHHWLKLATKLTLELDHSLEQNGHPHCAALLQS
jgi:hypothetical protein